MKRIISKTESLCPVCLKKIKAIIWIKNHELDQETYMEKSCPEHGRFKALLWRGGMNMEKWVRPKTPAVIQHPNTAIDKGCPFDCGLCGEHRQHTCTALIEVTQRCNLGCAFCFADANGDLKDDLVMEKMEFMYKSLMQASGDCNIQLSGGEPTLRDDLPAIIRLGHTLGFSFIQINTNGIRLGEDEDYVKALKGAGLNSVFLQFDGTQDEIFQKLRGESLLDVKIKALANCKKYHIGVVLVPTLVRGINDHNIGSIIDFAISWNPTVKGVHFQPASYFGRIPGLPVEEQRMTLGDLMDKIEIQTNKRILKSSFSPPGCENARCSFHGNYLVQPNKTLTPLQSPTKCCGNDENANEENAEAGAQKTKAHVAKKWAGSETSTDQKIIKNVEKQDLKNKKDQWDEILDEIRQASFSLSAMAFQDVWNVDLERVKDCCIHVVNTKGQLIPFCLYNLTNIKGQSIYRNQ